MMIGKIHNRKNEIFIIMYKIVTSLFAEFSDEFNYQYFRKKYRKYNNIRINYEITTKKFKTLNTGFILQ